MTRDTQRADLRLQIEALRALDAGTLLRHLCLLMAAFSTAIGVYQVAGLTIVAALAGLAVATFAMMTTSYGARRMTGTEPLARRIGWGVIYALLALIIVAFSFNFWSHLLNKGNGDEQRVGRDVQVLTDALRPALSATRGVNSRLEQLTFAVNTARQSEITTGGQCADNSQVRRNIRAPAGAGASARLLADRSERYASIGAQFSNGAAQLETAVAKASDSTDLRKKQAYLRLASDAYGQILKSFVLVQPVFEEDAARFADGRSLSDATGDLALSCRNPALAATIYAVAQALRTLPQLDRGNTTEAKFVAIEPLILLLNKLGLASVQSETPFLPIDVFALIIPLLIEATILLLGLGEGLPRPEIRFTGSDPRHLAITNDSATLENEV
jgi:hypothetical protein